MLKFKHKKTGNIIEVTEEVAIQLVRPQGHYEEVKAPAKVVAKPINKSKKKTVKKVK